MIILSIGDNIKKLREMYNLSQQELADIAGVTDKAVSTWENNINIPRMGVIQKISDYFHIPKSHIIEDDNLLQSYYNYGITPIRKKKIPMLGDIACGKPIYADEQRESYVMAGTDIHADFCLRAKGDSMINARIMDGDIVFIRAQDMVDDGEIAAVIIDNEATLKRVYYDRKSNILQLVSENPAYRPMIYSGDELNHVHILGKAIAFQSDII